MGRYGITPRIFGKHGGWLMSQRVDGYWSAEDMDHATWAFTEMDKAGLLHAVDLLEEEGIKDILDSNTVLVTARMTP